MNPVALKSLAAAAILACAASASLAGSVSGTGFQATYDDALNRFGTVDTITSNSFSWLLSGESFTQSFSASAGGKTLVNLPQVIFEALPGYAISSITFFVQGTGNGIVYSTDGFDMANTLSHTGGGSFDYLASAFAPTLIQVGAPYDLRGMSFWVQSLSGSATATSATFTVSVSAVPEPQVLAMLMAGLGVVGFMARRRRV